MSALYLQKPSSLIMVSFWTREKEEIENVKTCSMRKMYKSWHPFFHPGSLPKLARLSGMVRVYS